MTPQGTDIILTLNNPLNFNNIKRKVVFYVNLDTYI